MRSTSLQCCPMASPLAGVSGWLSQMLLAHSSAQAAGRVSWCSSIRDHHQGAHLSLTLLLSCTLYEGSICTGRQPAMSSMTASAHQHTAAWPSDAADLASAAMLSAAALTDGLQAATPSSASLSHRQSCAAGAAQGQARQRHQPAWVGSTLLSTHVWRKAAQPTCLGGQQLAQRWWGRGGPPPCLGQPDCETESLCARRQHPATQAGADRFGVV